MRVKLRELARSLLFLFPDTDCIGRCNKVMTNSSSSGEAKNEDDPKGVAGPNSGGRA